MTGRSYSGLFVTTLTGWKQMVADIDTVASTWKTREIA